MILLDIIKLRLQMPSTARMAVFIGNGVMCAGALLGALGLWQYVLASGIPGFLLAEAGFIRLWWLDRRVRR